MSYSPPPRRLSSASTSSKESLINAYEAEEERIINILSRKLEKLREEKVELENVLEAESENHVNRLSREISALRLVQQQTVNGSGSLSPVETRNSATVAVDASDPSTELMLDAILRENEQLRSRLVSTETDYVRISRLNEMYREELIEHRRRLGLSVDDLIGLAPSSVVDPFSHPLHRRLSSSSSPHLTPQFPTTHTATARVPIPRPSSQIHRPSHAPESLSPSVTPPSSASASTSSPSIFSPAAGPSNATSATTPGSLGSLGPATLPRAAMELTYPSVPPPSVASSFGEPPSVGSPVRSPGLDTIAEPVAIPRLVGRRDVDPSVSPVDSTVPRRPSLSPRATMRRASFERFSRSGDISISSSPVQTRSRMQSVERGVRVAETGTLVPKVRRETAAGGNKESALGETQVVGAK